MKKLLILSLGMSIISSPLQALHRTYIYLTNNTTMTNPIWAYLPYAAGAAASTASVPSDFPTTHWGTDHAVASGSTSIAAGATGTITSGNYDNDSYIMRVRIKTDVGDEVSFTPIMKYGNSLFGTSQYPAKFPGEWVEGDYTTPDKVTSLMTGDPRKPYGLPPMIKKTFNDGKVYTFLSQFIYNADDTNSKYTTTNWATNWQSLLADITIPPVAPAAPVANIDNTSVQQELNTSAPAILQSGFFNLITNKTAADYQITNKVGTGAKIGLSNGISTNVATLLGTDSYFNKLWITPTPSVPNPADNSQNPYIIIEPKSDQTFPPFTFTFDETASSPQITIKRDAVGAAPENSWIIYLNPIVNGLKTAFIPLPQQWSFDITIDDKNWDIIINVWNSTSNTYVVAKDSSTTITNHKFVFSAKETTYSTSMDMSQPTSQTTPSGLQGGLCGLQVLESNNPTCK